MMSQTPYCPVEWDAPPNVQACHTTALCGDFSINNAAGKHNWAQFSTDYQFSHTHPYIKQEHGKCVVQAPQGYHQAADAIFTTQANIPCCVVTADCVPILLCNKKGQWVAAVHAGWRGLVAQILPSCLQQAPQSKASYKDVIAWVGPCICQHHYEVNEEVKQKFDQLPINCTNHIKPSPSLNEEEGNAKSKNNEPKFLLDLRHIAKAQLEHLGVGAVFMSPLCTYGDETLYSFRQNPETGRIANMIWKNK